MDRLNGELRHSEGAIAAAILLAGALRPSPLASAVDRSVLNLYLCPSRTVLGRWLDAVAGLDLGSVAVRVIHDDNLPAPTRAGLRPDDSVEIEKERGRFRGPAGVVRDVCETIGPDLSVLIADSARCFRGDLGGMAAEHARRGADITVACDEQGAPAGLYLVRRGVLDLVPRSGFMDLKEQLLDRAVKAGLGVWVHRLAPGASTPLRTRGQFIAAAEAAGAGEVPFAVICLEADVDPSAVIVDSVVMPGALVGAGAVVARSMVCPGARIEAGQEVVDAVVAAAGVRSGESSGPFWDAKALR